MTHKAGYVNIIGNPNAGKSTLMNALLGTQLSIISPKAQTTRHRILGMLNTDDYQIVFSDTPGMVNPHYKLQETMMDAIEGSLHDADAFILLTEMGEDFKNVEIIEKVKQSELPILLLINKIDLSNQDETALKINYWKEQLPQANILPISALHGFNVEGVLDWIVEHLPENPPYFPKDEISDRNVRFFVSEIIREKISYLFQNFALVENFTVEENLILALKYVKMNINEKRSN
ncbi:MAG: GTPase Era, partial [Bacteroidales bacterium]